MGPRASLIVWACLASGWAQGGCNKQPSLGESTGLGNTPPAPDATPNAGSMDTPPNAGSMDTQDAGPAPTAACQPTGCPQPGLGSACCTAQGTGMSGHPLELVGRAPDSCGANLGDLADSLADVCVQLNQPGTPDPECPAQASRSGTGLVRIMTGCCTDEGFCGGLDDTLGPFGCFYATGMRGLPCRADADADAGS